MDEDMMPQGSLPQFGATATTTLQTTIRAHGSSSVRIDYPWPASTAPLSYATVTLTTTIVKSPKMPFNQDYIPPLETGIYTQTLTLPVLVLTKLEAVIVNDAGKTINRATLEQSAPTWVGTVASVASTVASTSTPTVVSTLTPTTGVGVASSTSAACSSGFSCWSQAEQIGLVVGSAVATCIVVGILFCFCCWARVGFKKPKPVHGLFQDRDSTSSEQDLESASIESFGHVLHNQPVIVPVVFRPDRSLVSIASSSTNPKRVSLMGLMDTLVRSRKDVRASTSTAPSMDESSIKFAEQERYDALDRPPPGIVPHPRSRNRSPNYYTHAFKAAQIFGVAPSRIHDFAYGKKGQPSPPSNGSPLTPEKARVRELEIMEIHEAEKRAEAQEAYRQGHADRPKGERRRRNVSSHYESRGDRLRKESPEAREEERRERKRSASEHRSLRGRLQGSYGLFNLDNSPLKDVGFEPSRNADKLERTLDAEVPGMLKSRSYEDAIKNRGRNRSGRNRAFSTNTMMGKHSGERECRPENTHAYSEGESKKTEDKGKGKARERSLSAPAIPRKSSQRKRHSGVSSMTAKADDYDHTRKRRSGHSFKSVDTGHTTGSHRTRDGGMNCPVTPNQTKGSSKSRDEPPKGKDKHRKKYRDTGKSGEREFGRYGSRRSRDSDSPTKRRHTKDGSPKKQRSKLWSLLPLAVPFVLETVNTLAEPEGGWDSIPKKDLNERSKSMERAGAMEQAELKAERRRRRELQSSQRATERVDSRAAEVEPPLPPSKVKAQVEVLDSTIDAFTARHKNGAKKKRFSRERRELLAQRDRREFEEQQEREESLRRDRRELEEQREREEASKNTANPARGRNRRRSGSFDAQGHPRQGSKDTVRRAGGIKPNQGGSRAANQGVTSYPPRVTRHLESPTRSPHRQAAHQSNSMHSRRSGSLSRKHIRVMSDQRQNSGFGGDGAHDRDVVDKDDGDEYFAFVQRHRSIGYKSTGGDTVDTQNDSLTEQAWEQIQMEELYLQRMAMAKMAKNPRRE